MALAACASACSKKPRECRVVVAAIAESDARVEAIEAKAGSVDDDAALLREAADVEDALAARLGGMSIATQPLAEKVGAYRAFASELASDARELASLLERTGPMRASLDPGRDDGLVRRGDAAFARIAGRCQATRDGACPAIDAARSPLGDVPSNGDYAAQAALVRRVAEALARTKPRDAELAADVDAARSVLVDWAKILEDLATVAPDVAKNQAALDRAFAAEKPLTEAINAICASSS